MKKSLMLIVTMLILSTTSLVFSQNRWAFELRGDAAFPTQELGDADLNTGFGLEAILDYRLVDNLSVHAGWGWHNFSADESFAGSNMDFEETGYLFGLEYSYPFTENNLGLYGRASALYDHIEIENTDGDIIADSGHGFGWRAEIGINVPFGSEWYFKPAVKYQFLSRDIDLNSKTTEVDLSYVAVGLGIAKRF